MSRIDELIADHCPDGASLELLGEVARTVPGLTGKTKADFSGGSARFISYMNAFKNLAVDQMASDFVAVKSGERQNTLHEGDVVFTGSSESLEEVGMSSAVVSEPVEPLYLNSFCFALRFEDPTRLLPSFSKYLFRAESIRKQIRATASGVTRINISKARFLKIRIPMPPLEVQREIVRILDQFTQLEAELKAELEARRRQYEHYRVVLLNSSDDAGVRDVSLGEIIRLNFGARITKKDNAGTIYPVYGGGGESFRTNAFNREDEWVISRFAMSANCVRRVAGKFWMLDSGFTFDVTDASVDKDFVGQLLLSMQPIIFATSTQSAQKNIDADGFKRLRVQVPSLETQRRVALALASFDGIVNDLSSGLPAELNARRKQYEYYRDKLLTFKELEA
jgi:type I restriction enzyme S subunit